MKEDAEIYKNLFDNMKSSTWCSNRKKKRCKLAKIVDFFVTDNSVVAKATFVTDTPPSYVEVNWEMVKRYHRSSFQ